MKEFVEDLKYMCSASNSTSRGFYIFIVASLIALILGMFASLALIIINAVQGYSIGLFVGLFVVTLILTVGMIVYLKNS